MNTFSKKFLCIHKFFKYYLLTKFPQETNLICGNYFFNLKHANRKSGINAHAF